MPLSDGPISLSQPIAEDGAATLRAYTEATREIMRVVAGSRHDEQPVFEAILQASAKLCRVNQCALFMVTEDPDTLILAASFGKTLQAFEVGVSTISVDTPLTITQAYRENRTIHTEDMRDTELYRAGDSFRRMFVDGEGMRTQLAVPLYSGDTPMGGFTLSRQRVEAFSDAEIALVETFAAQAVIAIENARQFRELQTRLEREAASRNILHVISQSRDDEQPVFDVILENAARLCGAPMANLQLIDAQKENLVVKAQWGEPLRHFQVGDIAVSLDSDSVAAHAVRDKKPVQIEDLADTDLYRSGDPHRVAVVDEEGIRTSLGVPLISGEEVLGDLFLIRREVKPFTDDQIALLETFAAQAVIAIENVRQFRELQTRLEREEATGQILSVISQSRDSELAVFDTILERASVICNAQRIILGLMDESDGKIKISAHMGGADDYVAKYSERPFTLEDKNYPSVQAMLEQKPILTLDARETELYEKGDEIRKTSVYVGGFRTFMSVPLVSGKKSIGVLVLFRREVQPFAPDQIALLESFAAQAVIAIENARQFRELQTRLEREAAMREILSVISRSPDDEQPVFDILLNSAAKLCGSPNALLSLVDDAREHYGARAISGDPYKSKVFLVGGKISLARDSVGAVAIREKRAVHETLANTDLYAERDDYYHRLYDDEGVRVLLAVPLVSGGQAIGAISLRRYEEQPFSDDQIALLETFAAQAVIAIENVRQFRELQTRFEREAATREILSVISQSRDDEQPVFDVILKSASRLCNAPLAFLSMANAERTHVNFRSLLGARPEFTALVENFHEPIEGSQLVAVWPVAEAVPIRVNDITADDLYRSGERWRVVLADIEGVRSLLAVPLVSGGKGIGAIVLYRREVAPFTDDDLALVQSFAAQAVIAVQNVHQFRELQTRLEREEANRAILQVISASRDDELPVFDTILESSRRLCRVDMCLLAMVTADPDTMVLAAYAGKKLNVFEVGVSSVSLSSQQNTALAVRENRTIHTEDMREEELYRAGDSIRRIVVDDEGMRTQLVIPLRSGGTPIGSFVLYRQRVERFAEREITLLETFAAQAVIAIENVRQFRALETLNAELGDRVEEQVGEIERMGRLKRFLSPQVANAVISSGDEGILSSHRALIGILFCDIRGFTAFCETAEPEETIEFLQTYHEEMGKLINAHGAGVDHRWGDGIMVIFNDPFPCEDPAGDALRLALAMREKMEEICQRWKRLGHRLGFGVGVSLGYATVGMVGSEGRFDYTANGSAVNMAARLCDHAEDGEILLSPRAYTAVEDDYEAESTGEMTFKGIRQPVEVFRVITETLAS